MTDSARQSPPSCNRHRERPCPTLDLETAVREHLAGYKAPRRIVFVEEIPRSPNGKADLRERRATLAAAG